jgi:hypothetical protein
LKFEFQIVWLEFWLVCIFETYYRHQISEVCEIYDLDD